MVFRFTSDMIEARHRASFLTEEIGRRFTQAEVMHDSTGPLSYDFRGVDLGGGTLAVESRMRSIAVRRTPSQIAQSDLSALILFLPMRGQLHYAWHDDTEAVTSGQGLLLSADRAGQALMPDTRYLMMQIPSGSPGMQRLADSVRRQPRVGSGLALSLLRSYCGALFRMPAEEPPALAARHLRELVEAAFEPEEEPQPSRGEALRSARLAFLRAEIASRYSDPGLSLAALGRQLGVSERTAQLAFEPTGATFTEVLTDTRLERARELLLARPSARVVDVAFQVGFSDVSRFNKSFRTRFGLTPSDLRRLR